MQMRAAEMAAESGWSAAAVAEAVAEEEHAVAVADAMVSEAGWTAADAAEVAAEAEQSAAAAAAAEWVADGTAHDEAFRRWLSEGGHTPLDSPVAWAATRPAVGKGIDDIKGKVDDVECKGKGKGKGIHEAAAA